MKLSHSFQMKVKQAGKKKGTSHCSCSLHWATPPPHLPHHFTTLCHSASTKADVASANSPAESSYDPSPSSEPPVQLAAEPDPDAEAEDTAEYLKRHASRRSFASLSPSTTRGSEKNNASAHARSLPLSNHLGRVCRRAKSQIVGHHQLRSTKDPT
jgi:hypothetical protein